jgi:psp operon transcriptional activator
LRELVAQGRFREDLLDRLAFDVITVPPLRDRLEDILPLAYAFAINMASEMKQEYFAGFTAKASSSLLRRDWPVYRQANQELQIDNIAFDPFDSPFRLRKETVRTTAEPLSEQRVRKTVLPMNFDTRMQETEKELLLAGLEKARFNQRVAADLLGLTYHQLRGKIRKHKLDHS